MARKGSGAEPRLQAVRAAWQELQRAISQPSQLISTGISETC